MTLTEELAAFLAAQSEPALTSWLLVSFATHSFDPVELAERPGPAGQIERAFASSEPRVQERLKAAVIRALAEWDPYAHGVRVLKEISAVAALVRASGAVPVLGVHLGGVLLERSELHRADPKWHEATSYVIAVLHGFAPSPEVAQIFERWLYEPIDPRYFGQFFIGTCACRPADFHEHVPRIVTLAERFPADVALPFLVSALVRTVGLATISRRLPDLPVSLQRRMLEWLTGVDDPPAEMLLDPYHGPCLLDVRAPIDNRPLFAARVEWDAARGVQQKTVKSAVKHARQALGLEGGQWH